MQKTPPLNPALTEEELAELQRLRSAIEPFFASGSILGRRHLFALLALPREIGPMPIIHNSNPGRISDCMSHYIMQCGYANVFPHSKV